MLVGERPSAVSRKEKGVDQQSISVVYSPSSMPLEKLSSPPSMNSVSLTMPTWISLSAALHWICWRVSLYLVAASKCTWRRLPASLSIPSTAHGPRCPGSQGRLATPLGTLLWRGIRVLCARRSEAERNNVPGTCVHIIISHTTLKAVRRGEAGDSRISARLALASQPAMKRPAKQARGRATLKSQRPSRPMRAGYEVSRGQTGSL